MMKESLLQTIISMNRNQSPISDLQGDSYPTKLMKMVQFTVCRLLKRLQVKENNLSKSPQLNGPLITHQNRRKTGRAQAHHRSKDLMIKVTML